VNQLPYAVNTYSYTIDYGIEECMNLWADRGCTEFEVMMYPGHCWPIDMDAAARSSLLKLMADKGLRIVSLNMPNVDINIAGATKEMRSYSLGILKSIFELAGDLGVPGVVVGPGKSNPLLPAPRDRLMGWFYAGLDELVPLAERVGTRVLVENMPFAFLPGAREMMDALDEYGSDGIGVVYDVANGAFIGEDLGEGLRAVERRLVLVHVSDTGTKVYKHDPVGRGSVPFATAATAMRSLGFRKKPILEIISANPDDDILDSIDRLNAMGWGDIAAA
jgi:L-ribulose-5-phosphate 3-epimerase